MGYRPDQIRRFSLVCQPADLGRLTLVVPNSLYLSGMFYSANHGQSCSEDSGDT